MQPEADASRENGKGKKIVICCDGTGNQFIADPESQGSNSNVVKLYTALKIDNEQVGYYHPGVGTAGDPTAKNWLTRKWSVLKGLAFAAGFKDNVMDAYRYLMETFDDGDLVYLIGFSRGAYTARALAGLLDGYGLLCKGNEGHLQYAWNEYVKQHDDRSKTEITPNERFKETFSRKGFRVRFMGIWDTVSSIGWVSTPVRLFNVAQNPTVEIGRHAISIDERRCFYRDNLWLKATKEQLARVASDEEPHPKQDVLQVWFPGVHSDIGGSYSQETSGLSNAALEWLLDQAKAADANIKDAMRSMVLGEPVTPTGHRETDRKLAALAPLYKKPKCAKVHRSLKGSWWLLELLPHRYYDKDDEAENWRTPLGMRRRIPNRALIHGSVKERLERPEYKYRPSNLRGGLSSLHEVSIPDQKPGSIYAYHPRNNRQPLLNRAPVRIGMMVAVTALDLAAVGLLATGMVWLGRQAVMRR